MIKHFIILLDKILIVLIALFLPFYAILAVILKSVNLIYNTIKYDLLINDLYVDAIKPTYKTIKEELSKWQ